MAPRTAITNWPECAGSHATVSRVQATLFKWLHPCLPVEMAQMSLLASEWVGEENRTCQPGERSTGKQEEDSFPPRGVALAGILRSPLHWFDSQCWSPPPKKKNSSTFNEWKATSQSFMSNLSIGVELFLTASPPNSWIRFRQFFFFPSSSPQS